MPAFRISASIAWRSPVPISSPASGGSSTCNPPTCSSTGDGLEALAAAEAGAIAHMNADHAEALRLYATKLLGLPDGDWRMTGCDPDGIDLRAGARRARLAFPERVTTPGALRSTLAALADEARRRS